MMVNRNRKADEQRRELFRRLTECQDIGMNPEIDKICRKLYRRLENTRRPLKSVNEMLELVDEALAAIQNQYFQLACVCLAHVLELDNIYITQGSHYHMGILEKIKSKRIKREADSQDAILQREEADSEKKIFELQKRIAELYDKYESLQNQVEMKARECKNLPTDSRKYAYIRKQALILKPQMETIDQQLQVYSKILENDARYHAMLQAGRTTFELKSYLPDYDKSEALMEWIAEETQSISENAVNFGENVGKYEKAIRNTTDMDSFSEESLFDEMINNQNALQSDTAEVNNIISAEGRSKNFADAVVQDKGQGGELA